MFEFPECAPEAVGLSSEGILKFLQDMKEKRLHLHALMIVRHGKAAVRRYFAPYSPEEKHMLFSLSKSFTSTAVGFAVQDGLLSLADRVIDFFPELLPAPPCENMRKMCVKHLLTMNTGHEKEPGFDGDNWEQRFLHSYVPREPGTHFLYNTSATYMLSAILQRVTGKKLLDYLREKLLDPLGMSPDIWFEKSPTGVATGGFGLNVRVDDIARLGQFYLQRGCWEGVQLLDERWILDAQKPWSDNSATRDSVTDWSVGYGYQFWMCRPENVYRGDGAFGQYCVICPDQDMVIAINSGVADMGAVLQSIWDHILPTAGDPAAPGSAAAALEEALKAPVTPATWEESGEAVQPPVPDPAWYGEYRLQANDMGIEGFRLAQSGLSITFKGHEAGIPLSMDGWKPVMLTAGEEKPHNFFCHAAVRSARTAEELIVHFCFTETPFELVLRLRCLPHGVTAHLKMNVGQGEQGQQLIGYRV